MSGRTPASEKEMTICSASTETALAVASQLYLFRNAINIVLESALRMLMAMIAIFANFEYADFGTDDSRFAGGAGNGLTDINLAGPTGPSSFGITTRSIELA